MKSSLNVLIDDTDRAFTAGQTQRYRWLQNEVIRHTQQLKESFLKSALSSQNSRGRWNTLRLIGRHSKSPLHKLDPEQMNSFFVSHFQNRHDDITPLDMSLPSIPMSVSIAVMLVHLRRLKKASEISPISSLQLLHSSSIDR